MAFSLKAVMYQSLVCLMMVKHTMASSEIYIVVSPSHLIPRTLSSMTSRLALRKVSLARFAESSRDSSEIRRAAVAFRRLCEERS
jgi:hypothetical protein